MKLFSLLLMIFLSGHTLAKTLTQSKFELLSSSNQGLSQTEFENTILIFQEEFEPVVRKHGKDLEVSGEWNSELEQAIAQQGRFGYYITVYGGLARNPYMTIDSLLLTLCHELGHHLGGNPKHSHPNLKWSSVEGQADYFAATACMPIILSKFPANFDPLEFPRALKDKCLNKWKVEREYRQCLRIGLAGLNFILSMSSGADVSFEKRDHTVVSKTKEYHPKDQCRLDTILLGALKGERPLCWYKEEKE